MAKVSLILPLAPGSFLSGERIEAYYKGLENKGYSVEVLGIADPRTPNLPLVAGHWWRSFVAEEPGLASASVAGLRRAKGDILIVLEHDRGYSLNDLAHVIEPIERCEADLAVASRNVSTSSGERPRIRGPRTWAGRAAKRVIGSSDPFSGLVALNRELARSAELRPLGSNFTLELLARAGGQKTDTMLSPESTVSRRPLTIQIDDLRHLKRLGDDRFGNISRLIQFCFVGASGMVVDLSSYALFQWLFSQTALRTMTAPVVGGSLALALAGALAIALALTWNFSLNRRLTFSYARSGSILRQFLGYVLSNALGVGLSFSLRLFLPRQIAFFGRHRLAAAVVGIVAATGISFTMARWLVFARRPASSLPEEPAQRHEVGFDDAAQPGSFAGEIDVAQPAGVSQLSSFESS